MTYANARTPENYRVEDDGLEWWNGDVIGLTPGNWYYMDRVHGDVQRGPQFIVVHWKDREGHEAPLFYRIESDQKYLVYPPLEGTTALLPIHDEVPWLRRLPEK